MPPEAPEASPVMVRMPSDSEIAAGVRIPLPACPTPSYRCQLDSDAAESNRSSRFGVPQWFSSPAVRSQPPIGVALTIPDTPHPDAAAASTTIVTAQARRRNDGENERADDSIGASFPGTQREWRVGAHNRRLVRQSARLMTSVTPGIAEPAGRMLWRPPHILGIVDRSPVNP